MKKKNKEKKKNEEEENNEEEEKRKEERVIWVDSTARKPFLVEGTVFKSSKGTRWMKIDNSITITVR